MEQERQVIDGNSENDRTAQFYLHGLVWVIQIGFYIYPYVPVTTWLIVLEVLTTIKWFT